MKRLLANSLLLLCSFVFKLSLQADNNEQVRKSNKQLNLLKGRRK
ncbi:secreted protein [marine sediment metagenome]|uniref:Secreted protein n=1 Tax=marine sediment metagenome TaxID=412755 RepID=A0A1B6NQE6_9ZZZZ